MRLTVLFSLLCVIFFAQPFSASCATYTWKLIEATTFGDGIMPDGDNYGNSSVWYYQYTNAGGSFNPDTYKDLPHWIDPYNWRLALSGPDYYCLVRNIGILASNSHDAILKFVAPMEGNYKIDITLRNIDQGSNGQLIYLTKNDQILYTRNNPDLGTQTFDTTIYLNQGDSICLRVNSINQSSYDYLVIDQYQLSMTTSIPEPSSIPEPLSMVSLFISVSFLATKKFRR
jgi:hypothetical protein